jgi:hypothetical protein
VKEESEMAKQNAYIRIKQAMRRAEVEVLAHIRRRYVGVGNSYSLGHVSGNAVGRLIAGHKLYASDGRWKAHKGAGPVTPAVRGKQRGR